MIFYNVVNQTETQTGTFTLFFGGEKWFEYVGKNLFRYSLTRVGYFYTDLIAVR